MLNCLSRMACSLEHGTADQYDCIGEDICVDRSTEPLVGSVIAIGVIHASCSALGRD